MSIRILLRTTLLVAPAALLIHCSGEAPPDGFEAVIAAVPGSSGATCSDLSGTFEVASAAQAASLTATPPPDGHGLPVRLRIEQDRNRLDAWWQVPRADLLAFARALSERDPGRYFAWWTLAVGDSLPPELAQDTGRRFAALAALGPPLPVRAPITGQRCEAGWLLVGVRNVAARSPESAQDGHEPADGSHEEEIWFARNAAGDLLVQRIAYRVLHYSLYASATQTLRLPPDRKSWLRIPVAASDAGARVTPADLPPAWDPATHDARCRVDPARIVDFTQRVLRDLPRGADLIRSAVDRAESVDPKTGCRPLALALEFSAQAGAELERIGRTLRAQADVHALEPTAIESTAKGKTQAWRVVLE